MSGDRSKRIAELNDQLRARVGVPVFGESVPGTIMMTRGIAQLDPEAMINVWFAVNQLEQFDAGDDPYGEHDFGAIDVSGAGRVFWKIDYFENASCKWGSEHPDDPKRSYRVLTIMLAEEY